MSSFFELFLLRLKAKSSLRNYRDVLNDKEKKQNTVIRQFNSHGQSIIQCWQFITEQGTWANTLSRIVVSFMLCHFVGILFYFTLTLKYVVNAERAGTYVALAVQMVITGILLLPFLRVIILLAIPALLTSRLRTVLLVIIVSWSLQIPATNTTNNIRNTVEGVACVQERIKESSRETRQLAGARLQRMTQEKFDDFIEKAYRPFVKMRELLRELEDTVNKMVAWQREMIKYVEGMFQSCDEFMRLPYYRCNALLEDMYYGCMDKTFDALCSPIRLLKSVCHSTRVLTLHCEWPKALKKQLEENVGTYVKGALQQTISAAKETTYYEFYADTKDQAGQTIDSARSVKMNITYEHNAKTKFDIDFDRIKQKLRAELATFEWCLSWVILGLDLLIYPIFISPFIMAIIYAIRFNRGEEVDNYFLSSAFRRIDNKRQANGKQSLFPMLPAERKKYIRTITAFITARERRWLMLSIVMTILSGVIPTLLIFSDILSYHITAKSYDFFHSNYTRIDPPSMYELKISGDGFMSELFANLMDIFLPFSSGRRSEIWRDCFIEPTPPDLVLFQLMFFMFIVAFLLCFVQTYARRIKHLIAQNYFPRRIRPRAVHLYNLILNNRQNVLDQFMKRRRKKEETKPQNVDVDIDDDTQKCIRCSRGDLTLKNGENTRVCIHCNSFYCIDCFTIRHTCIHCGASLQKLEDNLELYVDSSCSDDEENDRMSTAHETQ